MPYKDPRDQAAAARRHYERNKPEVKARAKDHSRSARIRNKLFLLEYLEGNPCVDCGEDDPVVLDFDHVEGVKSAAVTSLATAPCSIKRLQEEIEKCEVRCANCHRRRTARENGFLRTISVKAV